MTEAIGTFVKNIWNILGASLGLDLKTERKILSNQFVK